MSVTLRPATLDDCDLLAAMNRELIRDEGSRNSMSPLELAGRMRRWLAEGWKAVLILFNGKAIIGYALFQQRQDEYNPDQAEIYIRQYYIKPPFRGKGFGQAAFEQLQADYFPPGAHVVVDVLETNPGAQRFWQKLGFRSYSENLRLEKRA